MSNEAYAEMDDRLGPRISGAADPTPRSGRDAGRRAV